jgi:hypothetical protein
VSDASVRDVRWRAGYAERLWPSPGTWLLVPGMAAGGALCLLPVGAIAAVAGALVLGGLTAAGLVAASPRVEVADGVLRAGRARVPLAVLGEVRTATGEQARQERGPLLDARAYLCIRGWVDPVVRVHLADPEDPTPYWLVSTRHPSELSAALRGSATGTAG